LCERVHHARREFERVHTIFTSAVTFNCAGAAVNGIIEERVSKSQVAQLGYMEAGYSRTAPRTA